MDLFPPAQLFTQPLVTPRARGLALQGTALFLDFENDVVDARQVLLRGFQLQLGGSAARLVFGDAGGFFDQRAPLGRARRQDLPDLALLDDGIRLHAEARIHQQVVHVPQAAHLAVDQVFALAGSVQPPADFHVAGDQRQVVQRRLDRSVGAGRCGHGRARDVGEFQPHLRRRRRLARVAAVEEHVFHALAAQALRALLAEHPGDGVHHVALAAPVRPHDGGNARVEPELSTVRETLEAVDVESGQSHLMEFQGARKRRVAASGAKSSKRIGLGQACAMPLDVG